MEELASTRSTAEDARRRALIERVRMCARIHGLEFAYPPATEMQVQATVSLLGFPLPPLLHLLYTEVANGGPGIGWPDETEAFIGAAGGFPSDPRNPSATLGYLVSRSNWRLHHCIEAALKRHPRHYVVVDTWPNRFVPFANGADYLLLDGWSGCVYRCWVYGELPLESPEQLPLVLWAIQFETWSLEDLLDGRLEYVGCGPVSAQFREILPDAHFGPLTSALLAPSCNEAADILWRGIYRDVSSLNLEDPDDPR